MSQSDPGEGPTMFLDESVIVLEQGLSAIQKEFVRQKEAEYPVSFWFYVSPYRLYSRSHAAIHCPCTLYVYSSVLLDNNGLRGIKHDAAVLVGSEVLRDRE
jgi:hypothetical protein